MINGGFASRAESRPSEERLDSGALVFCLLYFPHYQNMEMSKFFNHV